MSKAAKPRKAGEVMKVYVAKGGRAGDDRERAHAILADTLQEAHEIAKAHHLEMLIFSDADRDWGFQILNPSQLADSIQADPRQ